MTANDGRWSRVNELFHAAVARPPSERDSFLSSQCGADAALRAEVESLLAMHRDGDDRMAAPLRPGFQIGDYEVTGFIASGGMGDVYRARDTRLGRDVALKVLPATVMSDPDRRARFEREARTLASLTHPHIATIYGVEETDGISALALELVDGETLADRIARGKVAVEEALRIARQIAEALETAHEHGIVHRDLKPANVKVTRDGVVKVLDFGLAKLADSGAAGTLPAASAVATLPHMTGVGVIVGTPAYMSPEQARGERADQRSDIWAFGCVLYEMLTSQPAFSANTVADTLARVLASEPNLDALPKGIPETVRRLISRCLTKDRVRRIPHASVIRFLLDESNTAKRDESWRAWTLNLLQNRRSRAVVIVALVGLFALAGNALEYFARRTTPKTADLPGSGGGSTARFTITLPPSQQVPNNDTNPVLAISPDGSTIAYVVRSEESKGNGSIFLRRISDLRITQLPDTEGALGVFFAPDGQSVGFYTRSELKRIGIGERVATTLSRRIAGERGAAWLPDDTIVFNTNDSTTGLLRISARGGEVAVLTRPDHEGGEGDHRLPAPLPGGKALLFTITTPNDNAEDIAVLDLASGHYKRIAHGGPAQYVPGGYIVFVDGGAVRASRFDVEKLELVGQPVTLQQAGNYFSVSDTGTLTYVGEAGAESGTQSLVWVDRSGREELVAVPPHRYGVARSSPDGTRAVMDVREEKSDLWIWDFGRKTFAKLTFDGNARNPVWMPDGQQVVYGTQTGDIMVRRSDGTGTARRLAAAGPSAPIPKSVTPDARVVLLAGGTARVSDVSILTIGTNPRIDALVTSTSSVGNPTLSSDGRWLAYNSNESGVTEVYVRPFPRIDEGRWQISENGGVEPLWAPNGRELFYIHEDTLLGVPIEPTSTFRWGTGAPVLKVGLFDSPAGRRYDISPDGKRFLFIKQREDRRSFDSGDIVVVLNWIEELKHLMPAN